MTLDEFKNMYYDSGEIAAIMCIGDLDRSSKLAFYEFMHQFPELQTYYKATTKQWITLLRQEPKFSQYCDWSQFTGENWVSILCHSPEFVDKCDLFNLDGSLLRRLATYRPELFFDRWWVTHG